MHKVTSGSLTGLFSRYGALDGAGKRLRRILSGVALGFSLFAGAQAVADPVRITALGDSLTQGYGLAAQDGLVPQLDRWLVEAGYEVEMINAGVSGDTTAGGLSRLDWTLSDRPDVMIVALGGNDLLRGLDPALSRSNLAGILERLAAEEIPALLVGLPAPANYGPEFQVEFTAIYPELGDAFGVPVVLNMLAPINARLSEGIGPEVLMQRDMIHPNAAGVALIVAHLGPQIAALLEELSAGAES